MRCRPRRVSRTAPAGRIRTMSPGADILRAARTSWRAPQHREERMIHRRSRRQFLAQAWKFRRRAPTTRRVRHVVAEKPYGENTAALRARDASGRMQREHVKAHVIARLQF